MRKLLFNLVAKFFCLNGIKNIVLIGAGNVATQLGIALQKSGKNIIQVFSQTEISAQHLAKILNTSFTTDLHLVNKIADLYIISVSDDGIEGIAGKIGSGLNFVVHTSGSKSMDNLGKASKNLGVFYPLQTISKDREIDFKEIPICIEANSMENLQKLRILAENLSNKVVEINSDQRKILHLAAVFASNFPNYLYSVAEQILKEKKLDFELLLPLILETANKVQSIYPLEAQTGPAFRGDDKIIRDHLKMLENFPDWQNIYGILSKGIRGK
jgi:predicted short-subunit dehydrogenase-like oxidoreductase (DUF2520 family)